ncbi:MAG: hypothetical protein J6W62_05515 [Spirochaetia bacterium]|nr:hypothetical protein [Spirochaetia bacterium]
MKYQEQTVNSFLAHLKRHPIPEIISDECMEALGSVQKQYGDVISHGAGLEVRLGNPERNVDYIMNIDEDKIPGAESLWYEIDYDEFKKAYETGREICPCLFINTSKDPEKYDELCDKTLPPFLGEERARKLRPALDRLFGQLPEGAVIKQVGTMSSRGELDIMRLVIIFRNWETVTTGLVDIGWQGDIAAVEAALSQWVGTGNIAVNIDLGEHGVLSKIGFEVFSPYNSPVLVDLFLSRLEDLGLCLKEKGDALRQWIRICPDGNPFIQTRINYFKLNYKDGKISEAKAYIEQSPYRYHTYFDHYDRPERLDIELADEKQIMPLDKVKALLAEFAEERGKIVRFFGSTAYDGLEQILETCRTLGLESVVEPYADKNRWVMDNQNYRELQNVLEEADKNGVEKIILAESRKDTPDLSHIKEAVEILKNWKGKTKFEIESCFSRLGACLGGEDPKKNPNRGIECGCEAGRSFFAVRSDGSFVPCLELDGAGEHDTVVHYWEESQALKKLRQRTMHSTECESCPYKRRCLPCPKVRR